MYFIDSWIWIEFFFKNQKAEKAQGLINKIESEGGVIDSLVIMEVKYKMLKVHGKEVSDLVIQVIENIKNLRIVPVFSELAKTAADLRIKYYSKETDLSYADAVHLATALFTNCTEFCTGDPDFKNVEEIKVRII